MVPCSVQLICSSICKTHYDSPLAKLLTCQCAKYSQDDAKFCQHLLVCLRCTHDILFCSDQLFNEMCDYKVWDDIYDESTRVARGVYDFNPCRNCTQSISFVLYALYVHIMR